MARVDLDVPFAEKDEAKALGAHWDAINRRWYVPDGLDQAPFARWLPSVSDATAENVRADRFGVALSETNCWKCHVRMPVACLVVGRDHQLNLGDREEDWEAVGYASALSNVTYASPAAIDQVRTIAPWFQKAYSQMAGGEYWGNVCENCGALQGDFYLHSQPGSAFFPADSATSASIRVRWFAVPLRACADVDIDNDWVEESTL